MGILGCNCMLIVLAVENVDCILRLLLLSELISCWTGK